MNYLTILLIISLPIIYFISFIKKSVGIKMSLADLITIIFTNTVNLSILFSAIFIFLDYSTELEQEFTMLLSFGLAVYILIILLVIFLKRQSKKELNPVDKLQAIKTLYLSDILFLFIVIFIILKIILGLPIILALVLSLLLALFIAPESCKDKDGRDCYSRFNIFRTLKDRFTNPTSHKKVLKKSFFTNIDGVKTIVNIGIEKLTKRKNKKKDIKVKEKIETPVKTIDKQKPISKPQKTKLDENGGSLYQKALEFNRLKQYDTSLIFLNRALELSNNGDYLFLVKIYRAMGIALEGKEDFNTSLFCYNKAMYISVEFLEKKHPTARYEIACEELERLGLEKETYHTK